jgi:phosphoglycolate phosphatase
MVSGKHPNDVLLVDLDGTLIDPAEGVIGCFRGAVEAMGGTAPAPEDLTWIIGPPLRASFGEVLGAGADAEKALSFYRACYGTKGLFQATLYDGVAKALAELKAGGASLVLCTSKPIDYSRPILHHFGLDPYFLADYGADLEGRFDDKGRLIGHILEEQSLDPQDCVMWGDRKHDVIAAREHSIPTIGALWGYGGKQELKAFGAAVLCASPAEVPAAFRNLAAARRASRSAAQ